MITAIMAQKAEQRECGRSQETEVLREVVGMACYRKNVGLRISYTTVAHSSTTGWDIVFPGPVLSSVKGE